MHTTMDEDYYLEDVEEQFAFGEELNDTDIIFADYAAAPRTQTATWQRIVEMKSAAHEGYLSYHILCEREQEGLPVYAKSLFSVHSPIEQFSMATDFFTGTIADRQVYLEHRQTVIGKLNDLVLASQKGSPVSFKLDEVRELLAMQVYGFGRAALQENEIAMALDAFHIAGVLRKEKVISLLREYVVENPNVEEQVKEYIHFNV